MENCIEMSLHKTFDELCRGNKVQQQCQTNKAIEGRNVRIKCDRDTGTSGLIRYLLKTSVHTKPEEDEYVKKFKELEAKKILENDVVKEEIAKIRQEHAEELAKKNEELGKKDEEIAKIRQEYEDKLAKQLEEQIQKDNEVGRKMRMENKQKALGQKALATADKQPQQKLPESIPIPSEATKFCIRQSLPIFSDIVPPVGPTLPDDFLDLSHYQTEKGDDEIVKESAD